MGKQRKLPLFSPHPNCSAHKPISSEFSTVWCGFSFRAISVRFHCPSPPTPNCPTCLPGITSSNPGLSFSLTVSSGWAMIIALRPPSPNPRRTPLCFGYQTNFGINTAQNVVAKVAKEDNSLGPQPDWKWTFLIELCSMQMHTEYQKPMSIEPIHNTAYPKQFTIVCGCAKGK